MQEASNKSLKNCNLGVTGSGTRKSILRKRKSQGLIKVKSHDAVKSCLVRIVLNSKASEKIFVLKESQVVLG